MFSPTYLVEHFLAGSWDLIWHWGAGVAVIILLLGGAWFSPVFKKDFVYAAIVVAVALGFELVGVQDEAARCKAQQLLTIQYVDKAVTKAKATHARKVRDPYDNPRN